MTLQRLESWQFSNIQYAMNNAVREALTYGLEANELRNLLADCWQEILREKGDLGRQAILRTNI